MFQTKVSVFEEAFILDRSIFLSVEALKHEFSDLHHKVIPVTQSMKIVEKSKHIGIITFKGSTNLGLGLPKVDARSDDPRLVSTC